MRSARIAGAILVATLLAASCDWSMGGYGPGRTHVNPFETAVSFDNVSQLGLGWTNDAGTAAINSEPAVSNGVMYVGSQDHKLYAFPARPDSSCTGTPRTCPPLWTATTTSDLNSAPAVVNGIVYVGGDFLYAFDARGIDGCSGIPKTCVPLWTGDPGGGSSPAVTGGRVYVNGPDGLAVFDAAGIAGCSGTPRVCQPLWRGTGGQFTPAVAGDTVYVTTGFGLLAFDTAGCGGTAGAVPVCPPKWSGQAGCSDGALCQYEEPEVEGTKVYVSTLLGYVYRGGLAVFSTNPTSPGCPSECRPIFEVRSDWYPAGLAVLDGLALQTQREQLSPVSHGELVAYARGSSCTTPLGCLPQWHADIGSPSSTFAVADRIAYVGNSDGRLMAFDAIGTIGCNLQTRLCDPVWSTEVGSTILKVVVANGVVYATTKSGRVYAFTVASP